MSYAFASFLDFEIDPTDSNTVFACSGSYLGVSKTTNGGGTWKTLRNGFGGTTTCFDLAIAPSDHLVVYDGTQLGFFKTTDGGAHWSKLNNLYVTAVVVDPTDPDTAWAAIYPGVSKTTDGGFTWEPMNDGLGNFHVTSLALAPDRSRLYAATSGGGVFSFDQP